MMISLTNSVHLFTAHTMAIINMRNHFSRSISTIRSWWKS